MRAVEDADATAFGEPLPVTPEVVVVQVLIRRLLEVEYLEALRIHARGDLLDGAVFTGGIHALEYEQERPGAVRIQPFLQLREALNALLQALLQDGLTLRF